jgi:hypothetical protein
MCAIFFKLPAGHLPVLWKLGRRFSAVIAWLKTAQHVSDENMLDDALT